MFSKITVQYYYIIILFFVIAFRNNNGRKLDTFHVPHLSMPTACHLTCKRVNLRLNRQTIVHNEILKYKEETHYNEGVLILLSQDWNKRRMEIFSRWMAETVVAMLRVFLVQILNNKYTK